MTGLAACRDIDLIYQRIYGHTQRVRQVNRDSVAPPHTWIPWTQEPVPAASILS